MKKRIIYIGLLLLSLGNLNAQPFSFSSIEVEPALFGIQSAGSTPNTYTFDPSDFLQEYGLGSGVDFNCLWSFGDGQYSTAYSPTHTYPIFNDPRDYQVVLYATPIYSPLGPPPAAYVASSDLINVNGGTPGGTVFNDAYEISLSYNRLPRAFYESTFILTYRNITNQPAIFPVDFQFDDNHFEYLGIQAPGGEESSSITTLNNGGGKYTSRITFANTIPLAADEERTIFIQMKTKAAAVGSIDIDEFGNVEVVDVPKLYARAESDLGTSSTLYNDEVVMSAVGSWDPNNKIPSIQHINRDDLLPTSIRYRINFENVGTGPTSRVQVIDNVSPLLDISSFRFLRDKKNHGNLTITNNPNRTITFDFNNLILEGTNSAGAVNLEDCRYWLDVKFDIDQVAFENHFGSSVPCTYSDLIGEFGTGAKIIFDSHEPIYTNIANTEVYCEKRRDSPLLSIRPIFPNPAPSLIYFSYDVTQNMDLTGASIFLVEITSGIQQNIPLLSALDGSVGSHEVELDLSSVNSGNYILVIQNSNRTFESSIFIKQ